MRDMEPTHGHPTTGARQLGLRSGQASRAKASVAPSRAPVRSKRRLPEEPQGGQHSLRKSSRLRH